MFAYLQCKSSVEVLKRQVQLHASEWGYKTRLAVAAGCQKSYISQVLAGIHPLQVEHMCGLAEFWKATETELEYLINLVSYERAGTSGLRNYYRRRLESQRGILMAERVEVHNFPGSIQNDYREYLSLGSCP